MDVVCCPLCSSLSPTVRGLSQTSFLKFKFLSVRRQRLRRPRLPVQACSRSIRKRIPATYNLGIGLCVPSVIYHCCGHGASIYLSQWRSFFNDDVPMKRKIPSQCGIIISGSTLKEVTCIRWRCKKNKGDALKLIFLPSRIRAPPPVTGQV